MRIVVDFDRCDAHGLCVEACPEVFSLTDDDVLVVLDEHPPEALREAVEEAEAGCPKLAISVAGDEVLGDAAQA
jgi:ferredoxin